MAAAGKTGPGSGSPIGGALLGFGLRGVFSWAMATELGSWSADIGLPAPGHRLTDNDALADSTRRRRVPWDSDPARVIGHLHRYGVVAGLGADKHVLDVGSGEGFGPAFVATRATDVVAVDCDLAAVVHARATYERPNLRYEHLAAPELGELESSAFDVVSCLGIWTEVPSARSFVAEVRRLLVPEGVAVFSTCAPRRDLFSNFDPRRDEDAGSTDWLDFSAGVELLQESFGHVQVVVQSVDGASEIHELDNASSWETLQPGRSLSVSRDLRHVEIGPDQAAETALVVIASTNPVDLKLIPTWTHWGPGGTNSAGLESETTQLLDTLEHGALARLAGMLEIALEEALESERAARLRAATLEFRASALELEKATLESSLAESQAAKAELEQRLASLESAGNGRAAKRLERQRLNGS